MIRAIFAAGVILALAGCAVVKTPPFAYEIAGSVHTAPSARDGDGEAGLSAGKAAVPVSPQVRIEPSEVTGYENVPDQIKHLYGPNPLEITLDDIVHLTLQNNRQVKIQGYSLRIADHQIPVSKSIYDLLISATADASKQELVATTVLQPALRRNRNVGLSLSQLLPTGGTLAFDYAYNRLNQLFFFSTINPTLTQTAAFTLRQPLLRGFGPRRTNADIHIAQLERKAVESEFVTEVENQLRDALTLFWDLVASVRSYDVQVISYAAALDLLRINKAKLQAGVLPKTQVTQARARVEARREDVIRARQRVRDVEDSLKRLLFFQDGSPDWDLELRPVNDLTWDDREFDPRAILEEALNHRHEILAAARRRDEADIEVFKTGSDRKPQLDVTGSAGALGVAGSGAKAFKMLRSTDIDSRSIALEFSFPLQNRQRRFQHRQAMDRREQAQQRYEAAMDQVAFEVRGSLRGMRTARERIDITAARIESEVENLQAELKRFDVGVSTSFQVLEFQEDLAEAQEAHIQAVVDHNKAGIAVEKAKGSLLATYGVNLIAPSIRPGDKPAFFPIGMN